MARFLITNDDGIDAPGIEALCRAVATEDITVVAPKQQMSECGHRFTVKQGIAVERRSPAGFAVAGTPADCTRLGLSQFATEASWVLSGVNAGGNLGVDIYTSGTVAAAREATILGKQAIAFSHFIKRPLEIDWELVTHWTRMLLDELLVRPLPAKHFWNVNFPHLVAGMPQPELIFCEPSTDPMQIHYEVDQDHYHFAGSYHERPRSRGTDVDVCFSGNVAITLISL